MGWIIERYLLAASLRSNINRCFVGHVPAGAVLAGNTVDGNPLFVGRAHHEGSLTPGKIHRNHGCIYIPFNGREESILHYEVLVSQNRADWVHTSSHGPLPLNAIVVGNDSDGAPIYVGRAFHNGDQLPAKVIPSKNVAYGKLKPNFEPKGKLFLS